MFGLLGAMAMAPMSNVRSESTAAGGTPGNDEAGRWSVSGTQVGPAGLVALRVRQTPPLAAVTKTRSGFVGSAAMPEMRPLTLSRPGVSPFVKGAGPIGTHCGTCPKRLSGIVEDG